MRQFTIGILCSAAILAAGTAYAWQVVHYVNVPGLVTGAYAGGIQGSFKADQVSPPAGIPSKPSGGACLIFRAKDLGYEKMEKIHCANDAQCTTSENPYGYCELPQHKCWAKPLSTDKLDADHLVCRKYPPKPGGAGTLPIGVTITIPVSHATLTGFKISSHAKVRVLTRLNCLGGAACAPGGQTFVLRWGVPKQL
jgi:hypothetical protein